MHSAQGQIADRSHAKMFFAGGTERSLGDTDRGANLGEIKRPVGILRQKLLEPGDDRIVAASTRRRLHADTLGEASHHDMNQLPFQGTAYFRLIEDVRRVMGELPDCLV